MTDYVASRRPGTEARPEDVGYDSKAIETLDRHYAVLTEQGVLQGAGYLIARKGRIIARRSVGKLRHTADSPDLQTGFIRKTYSITKAITAVAIGQLIDRGLVYLHQSVGSILSEMNTEKHKEITLFHLLTHTSGLRGDPGFYMEPYARPWFEWEVRVAKERGQDVNWVQKVLSGPLQRMPGKEWIYSTSAYALLGEVIARVSGKTYEQYVEDELLRPLGMSRSFFTVPPELVDELCVTNDWEVEQVVSPGARGRSGIPKAGNGLYSSLDDLWKLGQMMLDRGQFNGSRVLSPQAVDVQTSNQLSGVPYRGWGSKIYHYPYGLGWSLDHYDLCSKGTFSHEGHGHSGLYVDPAEQLVFVFFVPSSVGYTPQSVIMPKAIVWSGLL